MSYKVIKPTRKYYKYDVDSSVDVSEIPQGYIGLQYIRNQRTDLGIQMTYNTSVKIKTAYMGDVSAQWEYALDNSAPAWSWFILGKEWSDARVTLHWLGEVVDLGYYLTVGQDFEFFADMSNSTKQFYINDALKTSKSTSATGNLGNSLVLGNWNSLFRNKYVETYDGNMTLTHRVIPVKRISDSQIGWYDIVSDNFITLDNQSSDYAQYPIVEGTSSDYDFYIDTGYHAVQQIGATTSNNVYKAIYEATQPIHYYIPELTSNSSTYGTANIYGNRGSSAYEFTNSIVGSNFGTPVIFSFTFNQGYTIPANTTLKFTLSSYDGYWSGNDEAYAITGCKIRVRYSDNTYETIYNNDNLIPFNASETPITRIGTCTPTAKEVVYLEVTTLANTGTSNIYYDGGKFTLYSEG